MAVRKAPWSFAFNHNALDSSQLRCMQLLTPDTTRRCESIVPLAVRPAPYVARRGYSGNYLLWAARQKFSRERTRREVAAPKQSIKGASNGSWNRRDVD